MFVGIRPGEFWELTHGEIQACIRVYNRREKERAEEQKLKQKNLVTYLYRTAALVSAMVWDPKKAPSIEKAFPELFGVEAESDIPLWKRQQAGMAAYAAAYNAKLKRQQKG
ncbi:MAG TPA: hypothetical protein VN538_12670 [Clostridia bacterium]|nr:hypothetical protein [Clostridia bacterium]